MATVALGCVFAAPDGILQNRVVAALEVRPGALFDEAEALTHLRGQLRDYAAPERIFTHPSLPRTASGKVDRQAARKQVAERAHEEIPRTMKTKRVRRLACKLQSQKSNVK
ncbi:AMP-binding enzyme [Leucobacter japonicus]|uniref:AMP-binding enzyme n=1 Tax=Leucobacter japonicus TaxID=1461259 RepID=UPI0009497954